MTVLVQTLVVAVLVAGCAVYATWALLPATARRGIASALLRRRLPAPVARFMRRHAVAAAGGCGGCDRNPEALPRPPSRPAPLVFHPRQKR